jgi:hypothetical protein
VKVIPNVQVCAGAKTVAAPPPKTHGVPLVGATTAKSLWFAPAKVVAEFKVAFALPLFVTVTLVTGLELKFA